MAKATMTISWGQLSRLMAEVQENLWDGSRELNRVPSSAQFAKLVTLVVDNAESQLEVNGIMDAAYDLSYVFYTMSRMGVPGGISININDDDGVPDGSRFGQPDVVGVYDTKMKF
jgi:hypothetical protein